MTTKLWYVATYGDFGIEVTHFTKKREYNAAVKEAEKGHERGDYDTYTHGEV